jgi:glycerol-3-phosphate dehydrogenase
MLKHIGDSQDLNIYAYEKDEFILNFLKKFSRHPYFFEGVKVNDRIIFTSDYKDILASVDVIIIAIPRQAIREFIPKIKKYIKPGTIIVNLAK